MWHCPHPAHLKHSVHLGSGEKGLPRHIGLLGAHTLESDGLCVNPPLAFGSWGLGRLLNRYALVSSFVRWGDNSGFENWISRCIQPTEHSTQWLVASTCIPYSPDSPDQGEDRPATDLVLGSAIPG